MAHIQRNPFERLQRHLSKAARLWVLNFRKSRRSRVANAHPILLNSIPKAGTHLVETMLESIPEVRARLTKTLSCWDEVPTSVIRQLESVRPDEYQLSHLPAHEELLSCVSQRGFKVLFVLRDPRDVVVSFVDYVLFIDHTHMAHSTLAALSSDAARLEAAITGAGRGIPHIGELLERFSGWQDYDDTLMVRYEDLVGEGKGGDHATQLRTISTILDHLNLGSHGRPGAIAEHLNRTESSTFRAGNYKRWPDRLTPRHKEILKEICGGWLIKHGYETSLDW